MEFMVYLEVNLQIIPLKGPRLCVVSNSLLSSLTYTRKSVPEDDGKGKGHGLHTRKSIL